MFIVVSVYFVIDSVRKLLDTPSYRICIEMRIFRLNHDPFIHSAVGC